MTTPPLEPCVIVMDPVEPPGNLHFSYPLRLLS